MAQGLNLLFNLPGDSAVMRGVFSAARMDAINRNAEQVEMKEEVEKAAVNLLKVQSPIHYQDAHRDHALDLLLGAARRLVGERGGGVDERSR